MKNNINYENEKINSLAKTISDLPLEEQKKLCYIVEGIKMANKSAQEVGR